MIPIGEPFDPGEWQHFPEADAGADPTDQDHPGALPARSASPCRPDPSRPRRSG